MNSDVNEFNQTCEQLNHSEAGYERRYSGPVGSDPEAPLEVLEEHSKSDLDVFSELEANRKTRSPRRKGSMVISLGYTSERRPSVILNHQIHPIQDNFPSAGSVSVKPQQNSWKGTVRKLIRAFYLLQLLYVGYVFPVLVIGFGCYLPILQVCLDCFQIAYTGFKLGLKQYRQNQGIFRQLCSFELIGLVGAIPFEFMQSEFMSYLFYLKVLRLVGIRREIRSFYRHFVNRNQNKFWGLIIGLHCAVVWMGALWISFSRWMNDSRGWYATNCSDAESGRCIVEAIYLVLQACLTIGYGDLPPMTLAQKMLMSVYMVVGVVIFSYFLAVFSNFFEEKYFTPNEKQYLARSVSRIERKLPMNSSEDVSKLIRSATRMILNQNTLHLEEQENFDLLDLLPEETQARMSQHFNVYLGELDFFRRFPLFSIVQLLPSMKELTYQLNDTIVEEGDPSEDIYIIRQGFLLATVPQCYRLPVTLSFASFKKRWSLGQYDVFPACKPRRFSIVSGAHCRILAVDAYCLKLYLDKSEEFSSLMNRYAKEKLYALSVLLRSTICEYETQNGVSIQITSSTEVLDDRSESKNKSSGNTNHPTAARDIKELLAQQKAKLQDILEKLRSCQQDLSGKIRNFEDLQRHIPQFYKGQSAFKPLTNR